MTIIFIFFFFKQKTAYEIGTGDWSSDVCSSDLFPQLDVLWLFAGLGIISAVAHLLTIVAFRLADASTLSPLVYLELVGSAAIGFMIFSEIPTFSTIAGAALIIVSGLVLLRQPAGKDSGSASK